jgi:hypothetical protein
LPFWLASFFSSAEPLLATSFAEVWEKFGAASWDTQILRAGWEHHGMVYEDNLTRFVDVTDLPEHRSFFQEFKERLKDRFDQIEIWITSYPLDVI